MINGFIGKKIEMTQVFKDNGEVVSVTVLETSPCVVSQVKTRDKDGYDSVQVGYGHTKPKLLKKPIAGHLKNIKQKPRVLREFQKIDKSVEIKLGVKIKVTDVFKIGETIQMTGTSKGKGFAGVIKRHGFHGGPKTHGQSDRQRAPGSIGGGTDPGRVYKGKKMPGHMGVDTVTIKGSEVVEIDELNSIIKVKGAVPGHRGAIVLIKKQAKN